MRSNAALGYSVVFFLSGVTGLVYELLWVRLLYQAFGSTIQSVTTVVAAYMGGLGLGAWWLGRYADRHRKPAALYGWLEIAIGLFGIVSPLVLAVAHRVYVATAGALALDGGMSLGLRFFLAAIVLLIPTTLMGGTLPALTRAFMGAERDRLKSSVSRLYALNTLGAMVGTALAGFFLIEHVGIRASLWGTAAVNIAIGVAALALARRSEPQLPPPAPVGPKTPDLVRNVALALLAITAFASLLDEIAWTRVLVMMVGASTYAFSLVLLVFLLGIGLGSALVARWSAARSAPLADAALAQGITGAGAALLLVFFNALPLYIMAVFQHAGFSATTRLLLLGLAVGAAILIPAVGMGLTFPLLTDLAAPPDTARGADVGRAYALNTLGSIAGAVLTGFVLVVVLGSKTTLRVGLVINGAAALTLAALAARGVALGSADRAAPRRRVIAAGTLASVALGVAIGAPGWSDRLIDLAPTIYARQAMDSTTRRAFLAHSGQRQLVFKEGWNATVSVWEGLNGRTLRVNGKVDASDGPDMQTQILLGLAPAAARPDAASALVIGFGSGVTARVLADVPGMQRVRVVEIEPAVLAVQALFGGVNDSVLARPTVTAVVDDARSALQLRDERFDVVVSEPSNPWVAGVATLYTPEFFQIVRSRLNEGGVFAQWVQMYQLPLPVVAGVVRNIRNVFPHVEVWFSSTLDLIVLASEQPLRYDRPWLERLAGPHTSIGALGREWLGIDSVGDHFGRRLLGEAGAAQLVERGALVHRDDRPQLEFVAARRFLDHDWDAHVFDSLIALGRRAGDTPGTSPVLFARAMTVPRVSSIELAVLEAARRASPDDPAWAVRLAQFRFAFGDTAFADSVVPRVVERTRHPEALLFAAALADRRGDEPRRAALLAEVVERGGDTGTARAALAAIAARAARWDEAAQHLRVALGMVRGSYRHPFPATPLRDALTRLALHGPVPVADSVLDAAVRARPGWATLYELRIVTALRARRCTAAAEHFRELLDFGIEPSDTREQLIRCRQGERKVK